MPVILVPWGMSMVRVRIRRRIVPAIVRRVTSIDDPKAPHESGEAPGTYIFLCAAFSRYSLPQVVFLMSSPSLPALQRLHFLDRSLPEFRDQLLNILYGEEYTQCVPNLQGDDSKWFVEYLDSVRRHTSLPYSPFELA